MDWYWKAWFYSWSYPDLAIGNVKTANGKNNIEIKNMGNLPLPVYLKVTYIDGTNEMVKETAAVWEEGNSTVVVKTKSGKKIKKIELGTTQVPDVDNSNNTKEF